MNLLSKWLLARLGRLRPLPLNERAESRILLPVPVRTGGMPLMQALALRRSERELASRALSRQQLADLLWAADGINRPDVQEHTAPSAMNAQEIEIYVVLAEGVFLYDAAANALDLVAAEDARRVTGLQGFVDQAPLDLVYVANHERMLLIPESRRSVYSAICTGAVAQNVYLYCASVGLASVVRGLFDEALLAKALGLGPHQHILLTHTVGYRSE
jgi:SagB-type dehydrogenase family enzyme